MNSTDPSAGNAAVVPVPVSGAGWKGLPAGQRRTLLRLFASLAVLTVAFAWPLASLVRYVSGVELHSHILLVPFISAYLLHLQLKQLPGNYRTSPIAAALCLLAGAGALIADWLLHAGGDRLSLNDHLALVTLAYVFFAIALCFLFLGWQWVRAAAFPVAFLFFMVPLPDHLVDILETASKRGSAETADWFFQLAGVPVLRNGDVFQLPGITLRVATECSGIRSSWVLFITSLVAAHLFLRSTWRRVLFVALVIPLGLLRNGFRIMVIGWLCVEVSPRMVDSPIHHRGGPLFFVLSLVPLFLLVWWLRRSETKAVG